MKALDVMMKTLTLLKTRRKAIPPAHQDQILQPRSMMMKTMMLLSCQKLKPMNLNLLQAQIARLMKTRQETMKKTLLKKRTRATPTRLKSHPVA